MQNTTAPYRADEVGSLLRTAPAQGRARQAREGPDHARPAREGRGRGDQEDHQEAGGGRPAARHRRRVPPLLVAFRLLLEAHGLRARGARSRHPVPRRPDQAREPARHGQARLPRRPSHARAFQVPQGQHQGHAEDDHPLAVGDALPRRAQCHQQGGLSRHGAPTSTTSPRSTARRSRPSTTPAAATCSSTTRCGPICAPRRSRWSRRGSAARTPTSCRRSTPRSSTRRSSPSPPTW